MVEFGGWEMPIQYTSILEEHHAVRTAVGLFDIDHMGQIVVAGPDALPYLQYLCTSDVGKLEINAAGYGLLCYADGGVVDDIFVYNLPGRYFIAVNAANTDKDFRWMSLHRGRFQVDITNVSAETCMLAIQGPKAQDVLQKITPVDLKAIAYHHAAEGPVLDAPTIIGRTGYTGEDGFELFFPVERATEIWHALLEAGRPFGLKPCGLGARDSLRFECKMPLYGHEISADITPIEAGLGWAVAFDAPSKPDFIGRDALLKQRLEGPSRRLVGFEMVERGIARGGYEVVSEGRVVGHVTTGMYAPTLNKNLGLALVPAELAALGTEFHVMIRGKPVKAVVVPTPFYKRPK
jgi:aminomethyltransferase